MRSRFAQQSDGGQARADTDENENADGTDASHRRFSQMIFYFDFICVNLLLSAFICVLYFQSSPAAGHPAPIPMKMGTQMHADASQRRLPQINLQSLVFLLRAFAFLRAFVALFS